MNDQTIELRDELTEAALKYFETWMDYDLGHFSGHDWVDVIEAETGLKKVAIAYAQSVYAEQTDAA